MDRLFLNVPKQHCLLAFSKQRLNKKRWRCCQNTPGFGKQTWLHSPKLFVTEVKYTIAEDVFLVCKNTSRDVLEHSILTKVRRSEA